MTDEELREKVIKHDYEFKSLTTSLAELSDSMKQLTKGLEQVIVLNERMVNMDRDLKDSFRRVHDRHDKLEEDLEKSLKELEVFSFIARYPKIATLTALGLYVMTFDNVRKLVFGD